MKRSFVPENRRFYVHAVSSILFLIFSCACTPSEQIIQTAIAQTQTAQPTSTPKIPSRMTTIEFNALIPASQASDTPSPTITLTETPELSPTVTVVRGTPTLTPTESFPGINWDQARGFVGEEVNICGPVKGGYYAQTSNGQPTFLNIGKDHPAQDRFIVLIWGADRGKFPPEPEKYYLGKTICVLGEVSVYEGVFEMVVSDPSQLTVP